MTGINDLLGVEKKYSDLFQDLKANKSQVFPRKKNMICFNVFLFSLIFLTTGKHRFGEFRITYVMGTSPGQLSLKFS